MKPKYPSLGDRFQSLLIDSIFIIILMFVFAPLLEHFKNPPNRLRVALFFAIWGIYEPLCMTFGFTLGNYIKKLRVRKFKDISKKINLLQALIRYIIKALLGWLSFLTIRTNNERRAIHDLVSGTVMIKV
ncbi:MAG TPA: RDD family protein [Chitinophagaceae bacterium]|nr:RDD family protein [Chitinophagaceae bacterium]